MTVECPSHNGLLRCEAVTALCAENAFIPRWQAHSLVRGVCEMSIEQSGEAAGPLAPPPPRPDEPAPPKRPRGRRRLIALLTAVAVLAVAFLVYRFLGDR